MLVYVLNKDGKPLMPCSPPKARHLLKAGKARATSRLRKIVHASSALAALVIISGCANTPTGPSVQIMPATGRDLNLFTDDDTVCRHYAAGQIEGDASHANWMQAAVAGGGTLLGAGLGAAIGGGKGALIGGAAGAIGGTAVGAIPAGKAQDSLQGRYDTAYSQCQYTRGNQVPGMAQPSRGRHS